ncbi:hypothetical protein GIB67_010662 [Kingdonia uniflora]|uniref:Cytochrome P450 n=1 Tax=Kingdonia uniflora TaxID=39325 RepID=A0A7J7LSQ8_9MAGN|nr:hypothetical protein GIB67_010662 [Kingdonia uniflora]
MNQLQTFLFFIPFFFRPLLLLIFKHITSLTHKYLRLPPGPKPWPIIDNIHQLGKKPHASLAHLAQVHGQLISLRLGPQLLVIGSSAAAVTEILKILDRIFSARLVPHALHTKRPDLNKLSLIWASECTDEWRNLRTICRTKPFSAKAIESQVTLRESKVKELEYFYILKKAGSRQPTQGDRLRDLKKKMEDFRVNTENSIGEFKTQTDQTLKTILLAISLQGGLEMGFLGSVDLFGAGTDTSASTIEWAMAEIIKNQESMGKVSEKFTNRTKGDTEITLTYTSSPSSCNRDMQGNELHYSSGDSSMGELVGYWKRSQYLRGFVNLQTKTLFELGFGLQGKRLLSSGRRMCPGLPFVAKIIPFGPSI